MLRITIHDDGKVCRLELAGRLSGPWVLETEYAWRASVRSGHQIELDMRELTGVDDAGRELLLAMHLAGVRLVVEGVWMKGLVEEIAEIQQPVSPIGKPPQKNRLTTQRLGKRRSNK